MRRLVMLASVLLAGLASCGGEAAPTTTATPSTVPPTTSSTTTLPPSDSSTTGVAPTTSTTTTLPIVSIAIPESDPPEFVIINATVITATGDDPIPNGVVVVRDGLIAAVGPATDVPAPKDAPVLDAGGGFVMPGLIDTHTHLLNEIRLDGETMDPIRASIHLENPLKTGLTTFRDVGSTYGSGQDIDMLRIALAGHEAVLPTIVIAGPLIAAADSEPLRLWPEQAIGVAGPEEAAAVTEMLIAAGVDQIKIFIDEGLRGVETPSLGAAEVAAITSTARNHGVWVTAHVSTEAEAWLALDNGVNGLAHWPSTEPVSDELIQAIVGADAPVATTYSVSPSAEGDLRRMLDAGVLVVLGTDAPGAASAVTTWKELDRMVRAGATTLEAILASTRNAAIAIGLGSEVGTIEVGKRADLLILGSDPLEDVAALEEVLVIIKDGAIVR